MAIMSQTKIQIPIGFSNLGGDDLDSLLQEDVAVLSPLFEQVIVTAPGQISGAPILFLYAHFSENGFFRDLGSRGVRQIVEATRARLVVVASPISGETLQKAAKVPGPKTANLIFTLDRKQKYFGAFFKELFERMRDGEEMLFAWVQIAPQGPFQRTDIPATILVAEAGKLVLPAPPVR
ncbi:hypothetical protein ACQR1I_33870 [Bradyrhizobium sp. HKCCYLS2038]|uniref:hypothetical protein n=1 Tax=unclassified Bradyrhizobium TaxID=2631580 RepID=UPI003EBB27AC